MPSDPDGDDTVKLVPPRPAQLPRPSPPARPNGRWQWAAAGAAVAVLAMGVAGWLIWPRQTPAPASRSLPPSAQWPVSGQPAPAPQVPAPALPTQTASPAPLPSPVAPAPLPIETADEAEIRATIPTGLTVFRFAANPSIIVLDFASLRQQGLMLNRVAALTEKGSMPRDRVLNDTELDAAITAGGDTAETFYYGHDYSAAELARFFWLASKDGIRLNPREETLHRLLAQLGWLAPDVPAGLISVPKVGANAEVTATARNAILRHELSHGEYFGNPAYAAYVHQFWLHELTPVEQDGIRKFLAAEEYDPKIEDLVENEMQAYLMFTRDPAFFTPAKVGMTAERLAELQMAFYRHMPPGWLRDLLGTTLPAMAAAPY